MSKSTSTGETDHGFGSYVSLKSSALIADWKKQFEGLSECKNGLENELRVTVTKAGIVLENGWKITDELTGWNYVCAKRTTTKTIDRVTQFLMDKASKLRFAVCLNLPAEGPMGESGVNSFDDYLFWPMAIGEKRIYGVVVNGEARGRYIMKVDDVSSVDDEYVLSKISVYHSSKSVDTPSSKEESDRPIETVETPPSPTPVTNMRHIQQLNWPPSGYPPNCTFSVIRVAQDILEECQNDSVSNPCILITCSNGLDRSAALAVLCCCMSRLEKSVDVARAGQLVRDMVTVIRRQYPAALQQLGTYLWLQYAILEYCYSLVTKRKGKEDDSVRRWLTNLRKAVYKDAT